MAKGRNLTSLRRRGRIEGLSLPLHSVDVRSSNAALDSASPGSAGLASRSVLQCFGQVLAADGGGCLEVGQRARNLEDSVRGSQGQPQTFAGALQPLLVFAVQYAMKSQPGQIEECIGAALAILLNAPGARHDGRDRCAAFARWRCGVERGGFTGHGQVQVDAVEQGAGELAAVALDLVWRAATATAGIAKVAARAGVHRRYQLETCRKAHPVAGAGDHDMAAFQRFAQDLEYLAVELRQFIEKQYALMRKGNLARLWAAAACNF